MSLLPNVLNVVAIVYLTLLVCCGHYLDEADWDVYSIAGSGSCYSDCCINVVHCCCACVGSPCSACCSNLLEKIVATDYDDIPAYYGVYFESEGAMVNNNGNTLDDPLYAGFRRVATTETASVNGNDLFWITVTTYYKGGEFAELSTLVGP